MGERGRSPYEAVQVRHRASSWHLRRAAALHTGRRSGMLWAGCCRGCNVWSAEPRY